MDRSMPASRTPANYFKHRRARRQHGAPHPGRVTSHLVHNQDTIPNGDQRVAVYGDEGEGTLKRYLQPGTASFRSP